MRSPKAIALRLAGAGRALRAIPVDELLAAWNDTLAAFLEPASAERRALDADLERATGLSPPALNHGLRSIGARMLGEHAAAELRRPLRQQSRGFSLVVLPAGPPGLILQSLLPALAARSPVLFKTARAEPFFAPAFLSALRGRLPAAGDAYAAATWTGGDQTIEPELHAAARLVVAYGGDATMDALESANPDRLILFGPQLSLGFVGPDADLARAARGIALDAATFDQRGCLSVHAVLADARIASDFGPALAMALDELAVELPPGQSSAAERAGVRLAREDADLRGLTWYGDVLDAGTVILEPDSSVRPSPGLRTVRIHAVGERPSLDEWTGRLQGMACAGRMRRTVRRAFEQAGVSRFAAAGDLQVTEASWRNGGRDLAAEFADPGLERCRTPRSASAAYGLGGKPETVSTTTPSSTRNERGSVR